MRNSKANASRFIVTVMFLIVTALSGFPFIKVLVDRLWISNIDTLPLHIMSLIPTTESSITATGIISIIIFIISIISMTALNYKLMDIPTMVGVWLFPFLFIAGLFYSSSSFRKISAFIIIAVCVFIFIKLIGTMRKNPENYIAKGKNPSFIFYIIYIVSTSLGLIGFVFSQLFKLNKTITTSFGILLFTGILLQIFCSFWFLIHSRKTLFIRSLMFAQVFLYTVFFSIKWHYVFNIKNSVSVAFCIVLLLVSGGFSIFQYKKLVQVMQIEK